MKPKVNHNLVFLEHMAIVAGPGKESQIDKIRKVGTFKNGTSYGFTEISLNFYFYNLF